MLLHDKCKIGIIDYGLGNIFSIQQAFLKLGINCTTINCPESLPQCSGIILPGVGAFGAAMDNLKQMQLDKAIIKSAQSGLPIFGICLGLQLLMTRSYEFGDHAGLNLIQGTVQRFPQAHLGNTLRVPCIGWNQIAKNESNQDDAATLRGLDPNAEFYFVHSYHATTENSSSVLAYANYRGYIYPAALKHKNVFATQFHPEKSGEQGLKIFLNWSNSIGR